tara:strand:- start:43 stop:861 length:819 start_codon:yes stop_codon:yes gene_type:complete
LETNFQSISFLNLIDENLKSKIGLIGYQIIKKFIDTNQLKLIRKELLNCETKQTVQNTSSEYGQIRSPHLFSSVLCNYLKSDNLISIFDELINKGSICHLYNGQICRKELSHNQSLWHRDLNKPYIVKPPLAYNALLFLGESNNEVDLESQKFDILPGSHLFEYLPDKNIFNQMMQRLDLNPGDLLVFDSLLWHRVVPCNLANQMFLNVMFTAAFLKQQINLLGTNLNWLNSNGGLESDIARILGYWSRSPNDIDEFRNPKDGIRTYRSNQG